MFVLTLGILLIYGIVPGLDELGFIVVFWLVTILYLSGIFIMSIMVSAFAKTSGISFIYSLLLLLILTNVVYSTGIFAVDVIMGPKPSVNTDNLDMSEINRFQEESNAYYQRQTELTNLVYYVSIDTNYRKVASALTVPELYFETYNPDRNDPDSPELGLFDILGKLWGYIFFLIAYPAVFFGIAYVKFMRMDLR